MRLLMLLLPFLLLLVPVDRDWRWPLEPVPEVLRSFDPPERRWLPGHLGADLAAEPGQEVLAAGGGRVHFSGRVAGVPVVSVSHGDLRTTYLPVDSDLARGDPVSAGDVLGVLAASPLHCRDRPCLHWGLRRGSGYLDPLSLLGRAEVRLLPLDTRAPGPPGPAAAHSAAGAARGPVRRGGGRGGSCRGDGRPRRACRSGCCAGRRAPGTPGRCADRRRR